MCHKNYEEYKTHYYPQKLILYRPDKYHYRAFGGSKETTYKTMQNLDLSKDELSDLSGFRLNDDTYYWTAPANTLITPDGNPFNISCGKPTMHKTTLYCKTIFALSTELLVSSGFNIDTTKTLSQAEEIHSAISEVLTKTQQPKND
jgi:hypothetical protein